VLSSMSWVLMVTVVGGMLMTTGGGGGKKGTAGNWMTTGGGGAIVTLCSTPTVVASLLATVTVRLAPTLTDSLLPIDDARLLPTGSVRQLSVKVFQSFWACRNTSSRPLRSSNRSSLKPPPSGELSDLMVLLVFSAGSGYGGRLLPVYRRPTTTGRSGSPSRKSTNTSWPILGMNIAPQPLPAHSWLT